MDVTHGTLLGGRVRYAQPRKGYRTGIEPVLMAASVPARPGERVLEAGTGAGAGLLCLMARVPGLAGAGIELDPLTAELARENARSNGLDAEIHLGEVGAAPRHGLFDHAFANPPWHDSAGTRSLDTRRALATHHGRGDLASWVAPLSEALTPRGTLTLVLPAMLTADGMAALLGAGLRQIALFPFWPKAGVAAKIILLRARQGGSACRVCHGLELHDAEGGYTPAAHAILRDGEALALC